MRFISYSIAILAGFLLVPPLMGCAQTGAGTPMLPQEPLAAVSTPHGRTLWGLYDIAVDPASSDPVALSPVRAASFHMNIRVFLENSPCSDCLKVTSFKVTAGGFNLGLGITHPFSGHLDLTGFDVRGIVFLEGGFKFPQLGPVVSSPPVGDTYLANPDGFTTLFNPTDYPGGGLFGYSRGKMLPKKMPEPNATLGAFKAFYSEGQSEDEGGRRAFGPGDTVNRTYQFVNQHGSPLHIGYAIDSCWEPPVSVPPGSLDDFPISANCPEPFRVDVLVVENDLVVDCGSMKVDLLVHDHQGAGDLGACTLEAPGLTDALLVDDTPETLTPSTAMYEIEVENDLGSADPLGEEILAKIDHGGTDPTFGMVPAWTFFVADVSVPTGLPQMKRIDPEFGYQGSAAQTTIYGSGFEQGAKVLLYQGINELAGYDVTVESSCTLQTSFDLNGPIGLYTVYVENPGGLWGELSDGFTIMKPVTNCDPAFHTDTLGSGNISAPMFQECDCAFIVNGPSAGMMLATRQFMWGLAMAAVNVDTTSSPTPVTMPGALGHIEWKSPWTIDVDQSTGMIFISWYQLKNTVEVYDPTSGDPVAVLPIVPQGDVLGLDTDGHGGFWVAYSDDEIPSKRVDHYFYDPGSGLFAKKPAGSFEILPVYGSIQDIAVLPGYRLYVLCVPNNGTILSYDISGATPSPSGSVEGVFPTPMVASSGGRAGDIEIDQTDFASAPCRIVAFANQQPSGSAVVKLDAGLNVLASVALCQRYQALAINPDPDISKHHLTLYCRDKSPSEYHLLETPAGW
jgi:hypothetical protein